MDARLLVQSKWMVSESFGVGPVPKEPLVTIVTVKIEEQEGDKGKENWGVLFFAEPWAKPLKVNRTHQRALILMFGNETDAWSGKQISLYAMVGTFFGKRQTAVRIKGSPSLKTAVSFQVKKFGGGKDTYDLVPIKGGAKAAAPTTPYDAMWKAWRDAGNGKDSSAEFLALIKKVIGKPTKQLTAADVPTFEAALAAPSDGPPPIDDEEAALIAEHERAMAGEDGVPS